ncbi:sucrose-phosphate phosphatase [Myxosarcina sp. GI1(2024)]
MNPFLFVTDLDNTLVGDDGALKTLNQLLAAHRQQFGTKIVYATGRSLYLYRLLAKAKFLLPPDALITSVGTEMYFDSKREVCDPEWAEILSQGWNREEIVSIASNIKELQFQPDSEQNPFKISYYLAQSIAEEVIDKLKTKLSDRGYQVKLIYSGGQDLDLLPPNGDKGLAVKFLRERWNIAAAKTVTCGDSGNDIALLAGEEKGIIVGNAKPELSQWYRKNQHQSLYFARAACAGGILEGLRYFKFLES